MWQGRGEFGRAIREGCDSQAGKGCDRDMDGCDRVRERWDRTIGRDVTGLGRDVTGL